MFRDFLPYIMPSGKKLRHLKRDRVNLTVGQFSRRKARRCDLIKNLST